MKSGSAYHQHDQRDMEETRWKKENVGIFFFKFTPPPSSSPVKKKEMEMDKKIQRNKTMPDLITIVGNNSVKKKNPLTGLAVSQTR